MSRRFPSCLPCYFNRQFCYIIAKPTFFFFFFFAAQARLMITPEQEDFLNQILVIPFEQRLRKALITLDILHAFCGGPEPSLEAR